MCIVTISIGAVCSVFGASARVCVRPSVDRFELCAHVGEDSRVDHELNMKVDMASCHVLTEVIMSFLLIPREIKVQVKEHG